MARTKPAAESAAEKKGRILVDRPELDLKSGDYATLPTDIADALVAIGSFDPNAVEVKS